MGPDLADLKRQWKVLTDLVAQTRLLCLSSALLFIPVGFINSGVELKTALEALRERIPAAVWLSAPKKIERLVQRTRRLKEMSKRKTKICQHIGTVRVVTEVARSHHLDILVVQRAEAGGHRVVQGAQTVTCFQRWLMRAEVQEWDNLSLVTTGGLVKGRGTAACRVLEICGLAMGIRVLASKESTPLRYSTVMRLERETKGGIPFGQAGTLRYVGQNGLVSIGGVHSMQTTWTHRRV